MRASEPISLRDTWFGTRLPEAAVARLDPHVRRATFQTGAEILREGAPTPALGIVVSGRVALRLRVPERGPTTVLTAEPGNIVGWSAVVPPHRATSTAVALVPTELLLLDGEALRAAAGRRPGPCGRRLSLVAGGGRASPQRHAHAAARPLRAAGGRAVVTATTAPAFLPRAELGRLLDLLHGDGRPDHRPDRPRRAPSSTTRSRRPPTCPPAGPRPRRPGPTACSRRVRTACSTSPSARHRWKH